MKNIFALVIFSLTLVHCSPNSESNNLENNKSLFQSDSDNIRILNEIIRDAKIQLPYVYNSFLVLDEYLDDEAMKLTIEDKKLIIKQNKVKNNNHLLKQGDIKFFDTIDRLMKPSVIIKTREESYNKEMISLSSPYFLCNNDVLIFFIESIHCDGRIMRCPAGGSIWVSKYRKDKGKWIFIEEYYIADMA